MTDDTSTQDGADVTAGIPSEPGAVAGPDGFERVTELNDILRGVNAALVSATTHELLAQEVCDRLTDSALYRTVYMADRPTWTGTSDRWTIAGTPTEVGPIPPSTTGDAAEAVGSASAAPAGSFVVADGDRASYTVEVASSGDVRAVLDRVQQVFPATRLTAMSELDRPIEPPDGPSRGRLETFTDRQQDVLEVAYCAGYFRWHRDSTAEEVAESLDISRPTLHAHLRKAQARLLGELFDSGARRGAPGQRRRSR